MRDRLIKHLHLAEGTGPLIHGRRRLYRDCCGQQVSHCTCAIKGAITGGWGHNFDANGLTDAQSDRLLVDDLDVAERELHAAFAPWFDKLDIVRYDVMLELCFQMGIVTFSGFKKMIKAMAEKNYRIAARELLDSEYGRGVSQARARRQAQILLTGEWM
jgi:lysozyme